MCGGFHWDLLVVLVVDWGQKVGSSIDTVAAAFNATSRKYTGPRTKDILQMVGSENIEDGVTR